MKLARCLLAPLALISPLAEAQQSFQCGGAAIEIEVLPEPPLDTVVTVQRAQRKAILHFNNIDFIGGRCELDAQGESRVVFQAYCGGSSCHDLDNWGIIDPTSLKVLLIPSVDNTAQATRLLGKAPKHFDFGELLSIDRERVRLGIPGF